MVKPTREQCYSKTCKLTRLCFFNGHLELRSSALSSPVQTKDHIWLFITFNSPLWNSSPRASTCCAREIYKRYFGLSELQCYSLQWTHAQVTDKHGWQTEELDDSEVQDKGTSTSTETPFISRTESKMKWKTQQCPKHSETHWLLFFKALPEISQSGIVLNFIRQAQSLQSKPGFELLCVCATHYKQNFGRQVIMQDKIYILMGKNKQTKTLYTVWLYTVFIVHKTPSKCTTFWWEHDGRSRYRWEAWPRRNNTVEALSTKEKRSLTQFPTDKHMHMYICTVKPIYWAQLRYNCSQIRRGISSIISRTLRTHTKKLSRNSEGWFWHTVKGCFNSPHTDT